MNIRNEWLTVISRIVKREDGYHILGETGKHLGGPYSKEHAEERLKQIEYWKWKKSWIESNICGSIAKNIISSIENILGHNPSEGTWQSVQKSLSSLNPIEKTINRTLPNVSTTGSKEISSGYTRKESNQGLEQSSMITLGYIGAKETERLEHTQEKLGLTSLNTLMDVALIVEKEISSLSQTMFAQYQEVDQIQSLTSCQGAENAMPQNGKRPLESGGQNGRDMKLKSPQFLFVDNKDASADKRVIIMRGLPGSGKSTKAQSYGGTIVSADDYFIQGGEYKFDSSKLGAAHGQCKRLAEEAMRRGDPIIVVDNTNTTEREYKDYVDMANSYGYAVEFDVVGSGGVGVDELAKRNTHGVPKENIERMVNRWQGDPLWPTKEAKLKPAVSPEELAKKWKCSVEEINKLLDAGQKVEREHTDSDAEARQIASHHIEEMKEYYSKLAKMEKTASLSMDKAKSLMAKIEAVASKNGYKAYAVGGFVRDELLGRTPKDLDIVAIKDADGVLAGINLATLITQEYDLHPPVTFPRFGTAKIDIDGEEVEFVAPRKEKYSPDSRKPEVERGTLQDDARRRDFTVNALYKDTGTGEILDPTGHGLDDIKTKTIRVTDYEDPDIIFVEDPLRALRAIRQSYALGFEMETKTQEAIKRNVERLPVISQERIRDEFQKILTGPNASQAVKVMHDIGLLEQFLPEMEETFGVTQDSKYHQETVDEHILMAVDMMPANIVDRLVALLHDISKPAQKTVVDGIAHFYGHEDVGAETAEAILNRLKFPQDIINEVVFRIKNHMRPHSNPAQWGDKAVRKFMKDMGEYLDKVLDFAEADIKSAKRDEGLGEEDLAGMKSLRDRIEKEKAQGVTPMPTAPLIDGNELKQMFNRNPGKWIGELHRYLADLQLENPAMTKDEAIAKAKEYMEQHYGQDEQEAKVESSAGPGHCGCGHCSDGRLSSRTIVIGTVGFNHPSWEGSFYPAGTKENEKLMYLARHIPSVEINATDHMIPRRDVFERWAAQTPDEFVFSFRITVSRDLADKMGLFFTRAFETIGHNKLGAVSLIIPSNMPFKKGDVFKIYESIPAHLYAFDLQSAAWVNEQAYAEIEECGGTIVRDHLLGGRIKSRWDYIRLPVYKALREAGLGNQLRAIASDDNLDPDPARAGEAFVYVQNEDDRVPARTVKDLMKIFNIHWKPSPVDLASMPGTKHYGPTDPATGPNNSALPSGGSSTERIFGPLHQEEEAPVDPKRKPARNPGDETLTPTMTFDFADGVKNTDGKVDLGY